MATIELGKLIEGAGTADMLRNAGAPTGSTFAGQAAKGAVLIDTVNAILYQNTGTQAAPTWTKVGTEV